ncbi:MAG TPA: ceramidase domain-containing protein [Verrucomicrobiae bacterium]|nr:ceramidase domain-containing protein [Verrucomicrobiae bacterium]
MNIARIWRPALLLLIVVGSLALLLLHKPFGQDPQYHDFADGRTLLGVPNFWNVISNIPFLFIGVAGLVFCFRNRFVGASAAWIVFFAGVALVSFGSAYYHWRPSNNTLVWDRLPMTLGFMAMFVALLAESINESLGRILLAPALLAGLFSVIYWHFSDDLRIYAWVQFMPLVTIPLVIALYRSRYSEQWLLLLALGGYVLAKVFENCDHAIYAATSHAVGGHALKHVAAAGSCLVILEMGRRRIRKI